MSTSTNTSESFDKRTTVSKTMNVWEDLGSPRCVVAPMVDASELAWRLLSRRHGAQLCYTPMLHSSVFCRDPKYRREALVNTSEDRPLIVQAIAKRGHYGAFLQDDWDLLRRIVSTLKNGLQVPVTCKLRVFPEINRTVEYARMLEDAGASLLTVHGRTREQKGPFTGLASWKHIKAVRDAVKIPVIANGNVQCMQDLHRCIEETQVQGVMSAEGNLYNPYIFESCYPACWEPALEYLELVKQYSAPTSYIRGHLFKLFHHVYVSAYRSQRIANHFNPIRVHDYNLELPPWLCQPYVRELPQEHAQKLQEGTPQKREYRDEDGNEISRKRSKKLKRIARRPNRATAVPKRSSDRCHDCPNPLGFKCEYKLCRQCCRNKCYIENLDCPGHRNLTKTRRQMAKEFEAKRKSENVI
ncbi:hypothetical protein DMN91_010494 [Ooceraea biroi]|uniref:DUS-like FMN-binding domain-containing protein n=1 Tax=Ooceraea biroi TaxID=2015173 RepID=A0A3L8D822_OOCBI|nr:hypothetical protein DMN91_010494 [Ooceraea biroi]